MRSPERGFFLYNSRIIRRYATINGPMTNPRIPKRNRPPIIEIRTTAECIFVIFETKIGLRKLSIVDESIPKIVTPHPARSLPPMNMKIATGTHIIAVPMIGKIPAKIAMIVRKIALGTPKIMNPSPARIP